MSQSPSTLNMQRIFTNNFLFFIFKKNLPPIVSKRNPHQKIPASSYAPKRQANKLRKRLLYLVFHDYSLPPTCYLLMAMFFNRVIVCKSLMKSQSSDCL